MDQLREAQFCVLVGEIAVEVIHGIVYDTPQLAVPLRTTNSGATLVIDVWQRHAIVVLHIVLVKHAPVAVLVDG